MNLCTRCGATDSEVCDIRSRPPGSCPRDAEGYVSDVVDPKCDHGPPAKAKDLKPTNPKDAVASMKLDLGIVPVTALAWWSAAHAEGARKYGRFNWLVSGARSTIYVAAACRHIFKWVSGARVDPKTKIHHLGNAMACLAILIDTEAAGKLNDDRPPINPGALRALQEAEAAVNNLPHPEVAPRHFTIEDEA